MLQLTPSPGRGAHIEHHYYRGLGHGACVLSKANLPYASLTARGPGPEDWLTIFLSSTIGTFFYAGFYPLDLLFGPYGCLPTRSLKCSTSSQKCLFLLCSSPDLLSFLFIYIWPFVNNLSFQELHQGTDCRLSFFSGCLEEQPRSQMSDVCIALFSSATDVRGRFPCQEQWPA